MNIKNIFMQCVYFFGLSFLPLLSAELGDGKNKIILTHIIVLPYGQWFGCDSKYLKFLV